MRKDSTALDIFSCIREVGIDDFITALLPRLNWNIDAEEVVTRLTENYEIDWDCLSRWPNESISIEDENAFFNRLGNLFNAIIDEGGKLCGKESTLEYSSNLYDAATAEELPSTARHAGVFFKRGKNALDVRDVAFCVEYKKHSSEDEVQCYELKTIFSMYRAMKADPARRFAFGLTVADCEWTLWSVSRAALVKSRMFNSFAAERPESLIGSNNTDLEQMHLVLTQIILSFAFAEETELGWDQTVTKIDEESSLVYQFEVGETKYTTVEDLNTDGACEPFERGLRVYRVKDPEGTEAVLKDYWLGDDQDSEMQLYNKIIADVKAKCPDETVKMVERHLITPIDDCFVRANGVDDHTKMVIMHGSNANIDKVTPWFEDEYDEPEIVIVQHKKHYRVVYKGTVRPLSKSTDYGNAFTALADVLKVLKVMHDVGWVYRNISINNLYEYRDGEVIIGKLGSLEYSKRTDDNSIHSARTGAFDFMAAEVIAREYGYLPETDQEPPFRHNALHDMDSLRWCAIWILFFLCPANILEGIKARKDRISETNYIFPRTMKTLRVLSRLRAYYTNSRKVEKTLSQLQWSEMTQVSEMIPILADIREEIKRAYRAFENLLVQNDATPGMVPQIVTDGFYQRMLTVFTDFGISCRGLEVVPSQVNPKPKTRNLELGARFV